MSIPTLDQGSKNHISQKKARELIAIYQTVYHSSYLVYQRVPPPTSSTFPTSSTQETDTEIPATRREKASEDSSARGHSWHESTEIENKKNDDEELLSGELQGVPD